MGVICCKDARSSGSGTSAKSGEALSEAFRLSRCSPFSHLLHRLSYASRHLTRPGSSRTHHPSPDLAGVTRALRRQVILFRNRRRLLSRAAAGGASLACGAGHGRSRNWRFTPRPVRPAAGPGVEVLAGRCGRPFWRARAPRGSAPRRGLLRTRGGGRRTPIGGAGRGDPASSRLRREHVEWRGPAEELHERGVAPGAGRHGWGARFGAPERLLGRERGPQPRGDGGGWAESS